MWWLLSKAPRIKQDRLPTGGRNIVLHFLCVAEGGQEEERRQLEEIGKEVGQGGDVEGNEN